MPRSLWVVVWVAVLALAGLSGCASPANRQAMTTGDLATTKKFPYSVAVRIAGGDETGAMDSSNVSDQDFQAAIEESIIQTNLFQRIVQGKDGDYELSVTIVHLNKPIFGATFTVDMEASWVLVKASDRSIAMRKSIRSTHSATFGDALVGVTRLRLAVEGAARKNIEQGLKDIAALTL